MTSTLTATFETRREAELVVERLVQELGVNPKAIVIGPDGDEGSVGAKTSGGDVPSEGPSVEARDDAPLAGRIAVTVDTAGVDVAGVGSAFQEFDGQPPLSGTSDRAEPASGG